jgi:hypothetical protein
MTFETTIYSDSGVVSSAWFVYSVQSELTETNPQRIQLKLNPGKRASVALKLHFDDQEVIPGLPIRVHWEAVDSTGRRGRSEEIPARFEDTRFDWQVMQEKNISIWWHDHPTEFGSQIFEVASTAVADQAALFQTTLDNPIRIMIYNTLDEFRVICRHRDDVMGGKAFPEYGITAQVVPITPYPWEWMREVIPHEISHLYFAQATTGMRGETPPTWLDEGIAQLNEPIDHSSLTDLVQTAAQQGDLIPLTDLMEGFDPYYGEHLDLAYAESFSAVQFLTQTHGLETLTYLFAIYRLGWSTDNTFKSVLGYDLGEFQQRWLGWLGTAMIFAPTSTPSPADFRVHSSAATKIAINKEIESTFTPTRISEARHSTQNDMMDPSNPLPKACIAFALPSVFLLALVLMIVVVRRNLDMKTRR